MKMASRSIDLITKKKTNWMCSTLFFIISKKKPNLYVQHAFCLSLLLFCTTTTLLCRTKSSNFLVTHYFYGWIVVSAYPIFCLLCSCSLLFFTASHFHLAGPSLLAASISRCLTAALNFHVFLATKSVSLFSITCSSSFSVIHVSVNMKNNVDKDTTLLLFFLS